MTLPTRLVLILAAVQLFWVSPSLPQEDSAGAKIDLQASVPYSGVEQDDPQLSEAESLLRLRRDIEADRARLAEIKIELGEREAFFERLAANIEESESKAADKRTQLAELGGAEASDEAATLAAEIQSLEELIRIAKKQSDLVFESAKTLQSQIVALEAKIAKMESTFEERAGPSADELAAGPEPAPETPTPETPTPGLTPGQILMPGTAVAPGAAPKPVVPALPETVEQIEARRDAERAEEEARRAESAFVGYVERKQNLENQIEMEQQLLQAALESRDNLDAGIETVQAELERLIEEDAGQKRLQETRGTLETIQDLQREVRAEIDQRREYLESLYERLENLHEEQLVVQQEAEARRLEAEEARKKSIWLESPLHPRNLWSWISTRGPRMILVVVVAWMLLALVRWSARRVAKTVVGVGVKERSRGANRADTLALSFRSALSLVIVIGAILLVFQEAGVDIRTVLGGAAILGVALAFGAQNLMRDYFTGFMILLEDQYELGDLITVGNITGRVERVNMRTTMLRDLEGRVHFIPNGDIKAVTNRTYVWGRAVLEIPVSYKEDVERVMQVIQQVGEEFRQDPEMGDWVTDEPVMLGVDKFTEYGVVIKYMVQTRPDKIFPARRQLLLRIKKRFDQEGIEISVPHRVLIQEKVGESGS